MTVFVRGTGLLLPKPKPKTQTLICRPTHELGWRRLGHQMYQVVHERPVIHHRSERELLGPLNGYPVKQLAQVEVEMCR